MVDPTDKVKDLYEFLLDVEDEILKKLQHGDSSSVDLISLHSVSP